MWSKNRSAARQGLPGGGFSGVMLGGIYTLQVTQTPSPNQARAVVIGFVAARMYAQVAGY